MIRVPVPRTTEKPVFVGVDAGGSSVIVRAVAGANVIFSSSSGPTNATCQPQGMLERHLDEACAGCPEPRRLAVCVAGIWAAAGRQAITAFFDRRFPGCDVRLAPDYVAALIASGDRCDVCCVAGTGSVCSSVAGGKIRVSGGLGFIMGDEGSAYRYGRALVAFALERPAAEIPPPVADALRDVFGHLDQHDIVAAVHDSPAPAALLGGLAPVLTASADAGEAWATAIVESEAQPLARTVALHVQQHHPALERVRVVLAGGVWASEAVRSAFATALHKHLRPVMVTADVLGVDPVEGAIALAQFSDAEASRFGC